MTSEHNSLHDALASLATTMSPNPDRLRQVRGHVARRRRRRLATGAAVSVGAVAGVVGIAMVPRGQRDLIPSVAASSPLPVCASVPAPSLPPDKSVSPGTPVAKPSVDPNAVGVDPNVVTGYKGTATVTQVDSGTLTLGDFSEPAVAPTGDSLVTVVDATTTFENDGAPATAADVAVGQHVVFAASIGADGRNHLDMIDLGLDAAAAASRPNDASTAAIKQAGVPADSVAAGSKEAASIAGTVIGKGVIDAAPTNNELAIHMWVDGDNQQPERLVLGTDTRYFRGDTLCTGAELTAGTPIMFIAMANADGTYAASEVHY